MEVRRNYKSDLDFVLRLYDCKGEEVGFPEYDWRARLWTTEKGNAVTIGCEGGVCRNCFDDGGSVHVVLDGHGLGPGRLHMEFTAFLADGMYADGDERVVSPMELDVWLVREAVCPTSAEVEAQLPYIKGEPFTYDDFTEAQLDDLRRPAVEAAERADSALEAAEEATAEAVKSNRELAGYVADSKAAEEARAEAENGRVSAEKERVTAEERRAAAESERVKGESERVIAEEERKEAEGGRVAAEAIRNESERTRETAEGERMERESERMVSEETRKSDEEGRVAAEGLRVSRENQRVDNEEGRVSAEEERAEAESRREAAESERADEFALWEGELDSKADRSELSNVFAEEPLTPENFPGIGTYTREELKMDLFIDMWNTKCIKPEYGCYDPENAPDAEHPFYLNELWLTYEEALKVDRYSTIAVLTEVAANNYFGGGCQICRTLYPMLTAPTASLRFLTIYSDLETVRILPYYTTYFNCVDLRESFMGSSLRKVFGIFNFPQVDSAGLIIYNWIGKNLEEFSGAKLKCSISVAPSPKLNLHTFQFMVANASNTSPITITVHPEVYAKLTDESNTEWHALLAQGAEKDITFATV